MTDEAANPELTVPALAETAEPEAIQCTSPASGTPSMMEGPYYKADSPERTSLLEPGIPGELLILTGFILNTNCEPIPNAWMDFWQTDGNGEYDNTGYKLRGHQFTGEDGRYYLETVIPGLYPGRTAHIHVKVQAPDEPVLTTQLFIPGEPGNQRDIIFSEELVIDLQETDDGLQGTFNFVLDED
ncbi:MAG: dioxygenase [Chloroflexi bacterium]|nr:MAG: dioxygenase [Chloroflexota bacterium]